MASPSEEERLVAWIERTLGGAVEKCERQTRWRPAWFVDLRRGDERLQLYVRGDRNEAFPPWPLEYEAEVLTRLGAAGIPVPHVYGVCDEPHAIVMEQSGGRPNLATAKDETERRSVLNHLAEIMAAMHQLDVQPFARLGMDHPSAPADIALNYYRHCDALYLSGKTRPDPRVEFIRRWVARNTPQSVSVARLAHIDSGQFLFEDGRITAMLDFELACLGDPTHDLAALRARAVYEPMGDLRPLFDRYRALTSRPLDRQLLGFYSVAWANCTSLVIAPVLAEPTPGSDYIEYLSWYLIGLLGALRDIAELAEVALHEPAALRPASSRWSPAFPLYERRLDDLRRSRHAPGEAYELARAQDFLAFTARLDSQGGAIEADYVQAVNRLTGGAAAAWRDADADLEAFVNTAGPERDREILTILYAWTRRQAQLVEGLVNQPLLSTAMQRLAELCD